MIIKTPGFEQKVRFARLEMTPKPCPPLREDMTEALLDWICIIDLDFRIVRSNRAVENFFGVPRKEALGKVCYEVVRGTCTNLENCPFPMMIKTRQRAQSDVRLNANRWISVTVDPLNDEDGRIVGGVHMVRDITALRAAQAGREALVRELEQTLSEIKTLKGLIPICANCRRIRDQNDVWCTLEDFVRHNFDADLSHGLCPECAVREYAKFDL